MSSSPSIRILFIIILLVSACTTFGHRVLAADGPPIVLKASVDADGDGDKDELLYHWQDRRFSDEERKQTTEGIVLIAAVVLGGKARRSTRQRQSAQ
jgi:hypothetical protein